MSYGNVKYKVWYIMLAIAFLAGYGFKRIQLLRIDPELILYYPLLSFLIGWLLTQSTVAFLSPKCKTS